MKRFLIVLILITSGLFGNNEVIKHTGVSEETSIDVEDVENVTNNEDNEEEIECTMTVETSYGGYGIDGQSLGFKEYPIQEFDVKNGDIFIINDEIWSKIEDKDEEHYVLKIVSLNNDNIKVETCHGSRTFSYNKKEQVPSFWQVCDGPNWYYEVKFKKK